LFITSAFLRSALLLCLVAGATQASFAQAAAGTAPAPAGIGVRATPIPVDSTIPDDPAVNKMLEAYSPRIKALDLVIGKLKGDMRKGGVGAGSMGNFVTDGIKAHASLKLGKPVLLAVTTGAGLRKTTFTEGELRERDIFELLPFENALVQFDLTGAQVLDLLRVVVANRDAQSGARVRYKINSEKRPELESARLLVDGSEKEIDPAGVYSVVTIDYLLKVTGGDYGAVLNGAKNTRPLGITIRDAMINYVKSETAEGREIKATFDGRFDFDKEASSVKEEPAP